MAQHPGDPGYKKKHGAYLSNVSITLPKGEHKRGVEITTLTTPINNRGESVSSDGGRPVGVVKDKIYLSPRMKKLMKAGDPRVDKIKAKIRSIRHKRDI